MNKLTGDYKNKSIIASEPYMAGNVQWQLLINTVSFSNLFMHTVFKVNVR